MRIIFLENLSVWLKDFDKTFFTFSWRCLDTLTFPFRWGLILVFRGLNLVFASCSHITKIKPATTETQGGNAVHVNCFCPLQVFWSNCSLVMTVSYFSRFYRSTIIQLWIRYRSNNHYLKILTFCFKLCFIVVSCGVWWALTSPLLFILIRGRLGYTNPHFTWTNETRLNLRYNTFTLT